MDTGITTTVQAASCAPRLGEQPSPVQQPAAQPGRAPGIGTRLPQIAFLGASFIGMPPGADAVLQTGGAPGSESPHLRMRTAARDGNLAAVAALLKAGEDVIGTEASGGSGNAVRFRLTTAPQLQPANEFLQWQIDLLHILTDILRCEGTISGIPWPASGPLAGSGIGNSRNPARKARSATPGSTL